MGVVQADNWKQGFASQILLRGRAYFEYKQVEDVEYENDSVTALVTGGFRYRVSVVHTGKGELSLKCTCPYADSGINCKHEAAVLFSIESSRQDLLLQWANEGEKKSSSKTTTSKTVKKVSNALSDSARVYPFKKVKSPVNKGDDYRGEYEFFDFNSITSKSFISRGQYNKAKKLVDEGCVEIIRTESTFFRPHYNVDDEKAVDITALVFNGEKNKTVVALELTKKQIVSVRCNCKNCYGYNNVAGYYNPFHREDDTFCEHVLALLLKARDYFRYEKPMDSTDVISENLLSRFRKNKSVAVSGDEGDEVSLIPRLIFSDNILQLDFKIGKDRLYVLKSIDDLIDSVNKKSFFALGTKNGVDFATAHFSEESQKLYELIRDGIEEEKLRKDANTSYYDIFGYGYSSSPKTKEFKLYGSRLDRFYGIYKDGKVAAKKKNGADGEVSFREKELKLDVKIVPVVTSKVFDGIRVEVEQPDLYEGVGSTYYYDGTYLNKVTEECFDVISPLLDKDYDTLYFDIGRNHLSEFYHNFLPQIEAYARIKTTSPEVIERYIAPEAEIKYFLDASKEELSCSVKVTYGDDTFTVMPVKDGVGLIGNESFRDFTTELRAMGAAVNYFPSLDYERELFVLGAEDPDKVFEVLSFGVNKLMEYGEVHATDEFLNFRIKKKWNLTVGVKLESDLMSVNVLSTDISSAELLDILKSYKKKKKYHRLRNGDFIHIEEDENLRMLYEMMENLGVTPKELVSGKMHVPKYRALYLNKMMEEHDEIVSERDKTFKSLIKSFKTVREADYELPGGIQASVRSYQKQGFRWMMTCSDCGFGGILADDMGLGKTLQTICAILYAKKNSEYRTSIVVSPASLVFNWEDEIGRFAPDLTCHTITGSKAEREELLCDTGKWDVIVTSYDLLKRDIDLYEGKEFSFVIIDEAQYIKNPDSAAAKSVKLLKATHRFALTGTPIENKLSEMWSIFDFLMPGYLYGYEKFKRDFERPIVAGADKDRMDKLKSMVSPFVLRRLKADVLKELPDKLEEVRTVKFEDKQRELYDAQVTHMRVLLDKTAPEDFDKTKLQVLSELTKMRQICCNPSLLMDNYAGGSAKQEALMELVEEAIEGGHKMLIFSQFTSMLALIEEDLKKRGVEYFVIIGNTPKEERIKLVNRFNTDNTPVFLISLKAGGTGLNLVGADIVIHYDPWWNVAVENQATDRAHRIGQTKVVSVFKLIAKGTIEEKIIKLQEKKRALADEILKGEGGNLASLTREELLELLES